jgi:sigma-B regulation protein RsbU (phosphoserine phosphatase)
MSTTLDVESKLAGELELARQVQTTLLPKRNCCLGSWMFAFSYEPATAVGGDYVDLIRLESGDFYFALGDVSGKGIAASMLMSHLHATLRALVSAGMGLEEIVKNTSLHFCHSSLPAQFATLVLGRADQAGNVQLVNAGHTPVLMSDGKDVRVIEATSVPLGLFCTTDFRAVDLHVQPSNSLLVYSDGITESVDMAGTEYGLERLIADLKSYNHLPPPEIVKEISRKVARFTGESPLADDRSILVLAR